MPSEEQLRAVAWKWNWLRKSLAEAAVDFWSLASQAGCDARSQELIELESADLLAASRLAELLRDDRFPQLRIHKPLQWFFRRHVEGRGEVIDSLALARVIHWRLIRRMGDSLEADPLPTEFAREAARAIRECSAVFDRLTGLLDRFESAESERCLQVYRDVDRQVTHELRPFDEAMWQLPGLGCETYVSVPETEAEPDLVSQTESFESAPQRAPKPEMV